MNADDAQLEIAHVLFIDIVGYSKCLVNEQTALVRRVNEMVRASEQARVAEANGKLIRIPTGDGMALAFFTSHDAPLRCALEISRSLATHPQLHLRMGIHSGPVDAVADVNDRPNVAGAGINMAQRVMDCGDTGHILLSKRAADDLGQYAEWEPHFHDLGEVEVKHGIKVGIVNFVDGDLGNPAVPEKIRRLRHMQSVAVRRRTIVWSLGAIVAAAILTVAFWMQSRRMGSAHPVTTMMEKSIAVLPFESLSKDEENAFFAGGVQDEILTNLARIADLKVISRTSVMPYKAGAERNVREIARALGVAHILEGSVQRAGNRIRIQAQLIDARTDTHLWAEHYDRELADVFAIQSEIARAIADQLQAKISPGEKAAIAEAPTTDLAANALYARAREAELTKPEPEGLLEAVRLLDAAVARDPHFLLAFCMLGRLHLIIYFGDADHTPARRELADAAIQNAVRLQLDAGEVHLALARYAYWGFRDYDRARAELDLARSTLPNNVDVFFLTAVIDRRQGRWTESSRNFERAAALVPRDDYILGNAAETYQMLRRYSDATRLFQQALTFSPGDYSLRIAIALQPFYERADIRPLRAELSAILSEEPGAAEKIAFELFLCAIAERDSIAANRALAAIPAEGTSPGGGNFNYPREWFAGVAARTFNDSTAATAAFTAARALAAKIVDEQPDYPQAWMLLGRIDAALGQKEEAAREGRHACELLPLSKDAAWGARFIRSLAEIYAWTNEKDLALETLATAAQLPNGSTYGELKLDPLWDPLRGDPRFEKLVAALAPQP